MRWLTGSALQIQSKLPVEAAREAIRTSTVRVLSGYADSESCVSLTMGTVLFVSRTAWRDAAFAPSPVFRGTLQRTAGGSLLTGRFTTPVSSLMTAFLCACIAIVIGLAISMDLPSDRLTRFVVISCWILFCAPLPLFARWALRLPWADAERDQALVESHLRRALEPPAD